MNVNSIRLLMRKLLPLSFRQSIAQFRRTLHDKHLSPMFARQKSHESLNKQVALSQPIMQGQLFENKLANIQRGCELLHHVLLEPGQICSFWALVGKPSEKNGFVIGRNIVNGKLIRQVGGGLCQFSSLLYHLALLGGLTIIERHPHSIDIYREEDRFTPLGADATVVWGVKDLRFQNPYSFNIRLACFLDGHCVVAQLHSNHEILEKNIEFQREKIEENLVRVNTLINGELFAVTTYVQQQGLSV